MILKEHFYTITDITHTNNTINAIFQLNPEHAIFKGHFPGQPVVPGVCMLQMIKELLELAIGNALRLSIGNELKFLSVIDPIRNKLIHVELNYTGEASVGITINARLFYNETVFFKCRGVFVAE
jgi:3-hydroxyacyl-[acyl-carrier-protein] dehydratase